MRSVTFQVPGRPQGKARARTFYSQSAGRHMSHTPDRTVLYENLIKDAITATVSAHTEDECREDMEGLKEEILKSVQDLFQSDFIYKVAISGVKFG